MISIDKVIGFKMNVYLEKGQVSKNPKQMLPTGGAYRGLSPSLCSRPWLMKAKTTEDLGISVMRRNNNRIRGVNPGTAELIYKSQWRL